MLGLLQTIFITVLTLGILVSIHEFGHFWVARRCGVKVLRFSVGFGKPLLSWRDKLGTEYAVAGIPLGGYVKMLDEREGPVPDSLKQFAFSSKPVSQRIAIASAGPQLVRMQRFRGGTPGIRMKMLRAINASRIALANGPSRPQSIVTKLVADGIGLKP